MSDIRANVFAIAQRPGSYHCWAAVTGMMLRRTGAHQAVIDQVLAEARSRGVPVGANDALARGGGRPLASAFGFHYTDLRTMGVPEGRFFADFLRRAPFGVFGFRPGYGLHAIAIYRLTGDFSSLGTTRAHVIDPIRGVHPAETDLFDLVMPSRQNSVQMQGDFVLWR